jgi:hypothetical protein
LIADRVIGFTAHTDLITKTIPAGGSQKASSTPLLFTTR